MALNKLPVDSKPVRLRHRDQIDGRPRGYMFKFAMSPVNFRKVAHLGQIPGVHKASWEKQLAIAKIKVAGV